MSSRSNVGTSGVWRALKTIFPNEKVYDNYGRHYHVESKEKISIQKLDIIIPYKLEIIWGLLRPKNVSEAVIKEIIVASFYFALHYPYFANKIPKCRNHHWR